jgi:hypothetical protein
MANITRLDEIEAWQPVRQFANLVYGCSEEDRFARGLRLRGQMPRAAMWGMSSIVERFERRAQAM